MRYLIAALLTAATLGGCDLTGTSSHQRLFGILRLSPEDSISFVVPDTVAINTDFTIATTTYGGSCDSKGPTDVIVMSDGSIELRPFDVTEVDSDKPCPLQAQTFSHSGSIKVSAAGPKVIVLRGRDWNLGMTTRTKMVVVK